jgi:outer membrane protein assembly factor BamE (lipoprotein component of BamABCDE complex)
MYVVFYTIYIVLSDCRQPAVCLGKHMRNVFVAGLVTLLAACSALDYRQGVQFSDDAYNALQVGQTTRTSVIAQYGPPQQTIPDGATVLFIYKFSVVGALPIVDPNRSETVTLTFDGKGLLANKQRRADNSAASNPLSG